MTELVAPVFSEEIPARLILADGSQWSYTYPSVTEGTFSPSEATVSMSDEIQPFISVSISNSEVELTYDG